MTKILLVLLFILFAVPAYSQTKSCMPTYFPGCVITLTWQDNSQNEDGFRIYSKVDLLNADGSISLPGAFTTIGTIAAGVVESFTDNTLSQGPLARKYTWRVTAFNGAGESIPSNEVAVTVPALITIPIGPSNLVNQ